jgi:isoleucyl-tRNA synthetase
MQTVIDLGRMIRDRKTIPVKYPLPEVVVIHQDEQCLQDITSLEHYILEELNVRHMTITTDKKKYGVMLRAEPDHKTLGARLKGAFKPVMQAIKALTDSDLQQFLSNGHMELLGHNIEPADVRIMFSFSGDTASELSQKYEAHANNDLLVLLATTPDDAMQDEGIAREVINRVQKLRKKAHLVPSDPVTVYFSVSPPDSHLHDVTMSHAHFIENALKIPLRSMTEMQAHIDLSLVIEETQQLKGSLLKLVVVSGFCQDWCSSTDVKQPTAPQSSTSEPFCRYVNVQLCGLEPTHGIRNMCGVVLLENPSEENLITVQQLKEEIEVLFGLYGQNFYLSISDGSELTTVQDLNHLHKQILHVHRKGERWNENSKQPLSYNYSGPFCKFINVECNGKRGTVLTENPYGDDVSATDRVQQMKQVSYIFGIDADRLEFTSDAKGHGGHLIVKVK